MCKYLPWPAVFITTPLRLVFSARIIFKKTLVPVKRPRRGGLVVFAREYVLRATSPARNVARMG